ncbi:MAG TPA: hypothetical protein DCR43_00360 [Bacteroidales bacterium]|nr:MAG: hypothetical protein A2X11_11020 [Bacteroidetes bacterium GWE2_42_24]OFY25000.1 MAG: hypothetical protein A2X09_15575 [Bacteroidetes bacterium GWF2_43_11]PKP23057.1 MAG: hypothetical protein CVU06_09000 [Bacteroidetes bacterium HGW-Bacteroidetes-22]HAQ64303.1 hypothetical protein [Bacteroidales bacterium]HBZ65646.1 hypothetical protein [Bacteroidales bacterium]
MRFLIRLIGSAMVVSILAMIIPGIYISGFISALILVTVLSLLNILVKPILIILTIPVTLITFGLFLLVINTAIVLMAAAVVPGFNVGGFFPAFLFALGNSLMSYLFSLAD